MLSLLLLPLLSLMLPGSYSAEVPCQGLAQSEVVLGRERTEVTFAKQGYEEGDVCRYLFKVSNAPLHSV